MNVPSLHLHKRLTALGLGVGIGLAILFGVLTSWGSPLYAQGINTPTPTATQTRTPRVTATATVSPTATVTSTRLVPATRTPTRTPAGTATATQAAPVIPVTVTVVVTVTNVVTPTLTPQPTATPSPTAGPPVVELLDTEVLTGTILANRSGVTTTFFLEGRLYELPPLRSTGVVLARPLTVLTLYNCEIDGEQSADCFWDPYPVRRDGFYEIVNGAEAGAPLSLILEEAGAPPLDQVWIQNRTGHIERFMFGDNLYELENSHVLELTLDEAADAEDQTGQIYLRRCLGIDQRAVCEWLPETVIGGVYYALIDETVAGLLPNSAVTTIQLDLVLGEERLAVLVTPTPEPKPEPAVPTATPVTEDAPAIASADAVFCQIQVPTLNLRAGPGTEYLVVGQIRRTDPSAGRFAVTGRNAANDWLAVDESVNAGGWVINAPNFILCEGDTEPLAVARITDGRLAAATATPAPVVANPNAEAGSAEEGGEPESTPQPGEGGVPPGQVLLIATNSFDQDIRFTLSAPEHGLPEGTPSEYDLKPGQSVSFVIRAGRVQFSASSPFRSSSGNDEFFMEEGSARELFLRFVPSTDDPNRWELRWE